MSAGVLGAILAAGLHSAMTFLKEDLFDEFVGADGYAMVEFACIYDDDYATEFASAAGKLDGRIAALRFGTVRDGSDKLCDKYKINSYPQYILFQNGVQKKHETWLGDEEKIIDWISRQTGEQLDIIAKLTNKDQLDAVIQAHNVVFVLFGKEGSSLYQRLTIVANEARSSGYFAFVPSNRETFVAYRDGEQPTTFVGKGTKKMRKFVREERLPLFSDASSKLHRKYFEGGILSQVEVYAEQSWVGNHSMLFREAAKQFRSDVKVMWTDVSSSTAPQRMYKLKESQFPCVMAVLYQGGTFHRYLFPWPKGAADGEQIQVHLFRFVSDALASKWPKYYKSEDVPEDDTQNGVQVVVSSNFHKNVYRGDKDVILEMYSPGCHGCKHFAPIYDEWASVAKQKYRNLVVAKINGAENDCPMEDCPWNTFPSVFFFKKGSSAPPLNVGARTIEGLSAFVDRHGSAGKNEL